MNCPLNLNSQVPLSQYLAMAGTYVTLRASPSIGIDGMYATAEGKGNPVKVAAQTPSAADNQKVGDFVVNRWSAETY